MHQKREWDGPINMRHNLQLNKNKLNSTGLCSLTRLAMKKKFLIHNSGHKQKHFAGNLALNIDCAIYAKSLISQLINHF